MSDKAERRTRWDAELEPGACPATARVLFERDELLDAMEVGYQEGLAHVHAQAKALGDPPRLSRDQAAALAGHETATGVPGLPMQPESELAQPGVHDPHKLIAQMEAHAAKDQAIADEVLPWIEIARDLVSRLEHSEGRVEEAEAKLADMTDAELRAAIVSKSPDAAIRHARRVIKIAGDALVRGDKAEARVEAAERQAKGARDFFEMANKQREDEHARAERLQQAYDEERARTAEARQACTEAVRGTWLWADDPTDELESMSDGMVVSITAGHLRALLKARTKELFEALEKAVLCASVDLEDEGWEDPDTRTNLLLGAIRVLDQQRALVSKDSVPPEAARLEGVSFMTHAERADKFETAYYREILKRKQAEARVEKEQRLRGR